MSLSAAVPLTLRSLTTAKITQLSKQRDAFEARRAALYKLVEEKSDGRERVQVLLAGIEGVLSGKRKDDGDDDDDYDDEDTVDSDSDSDYDSDDYYDSDDEHSPLRKQNKSCIRNIRRFCQQSRHDSSIHPDMFATWEAELRRMIDLVAVKYQHAVFFSQLVTEWLSDPDAFSGKAAELEESGAEDVISLSSSSENSKGPREEMHEQREAWEKLVFEPRVTDEGKIEQYLEKLFEGSKEGQKALKKLRSDVGAFAKGFTSGFSPKVLQWVIPGVIRKDLLSDDKVVMLKDLLTNDLLAREVSDVLNMRLKELESWTWAGDAVSIDMKRQLNGRYRMYMDEDVLDALFVHFIGVKWAVRFKGLFKAHLNSAWKSSTKGMDKTAKERRNYFLYDYKPETRTLFGTIAGKRRDEFANDFFMCQLPDAETENAPIYDAEGHGDTPARKNFVKLKHRLHHLAITEARIMTAFRGEFTIVQSDFAWFGASLSHTTLLAVLRFFGMPEVWLRFFKCFLEAPLRFKSDGSDIPARMRKNGVPLSHSLSDWMGETLLFCMDYAVNQHADGTLLYRLHDDFWFWGEEDFCVAAWKAIQEFSAIMGLETSESKSGTARISNENDTLRVGESTIAIHRSKRDDASKNVLPAGEVKSGFLKLDQEEGRFVVDQEQIDSHIKELKVQLDACKSIFSWVRAWNAYVTRFFNNNFGTPATCFGREHIDMVIETLKRIEREVFKDFRATGSGSTSVTDYLRRMIKDRFDVDDLPDGFFYFPAELGGLELGNPFIPFLSMREDMETSPKRILRDALAKEETRYLDNKEIFEKKGPSRHLDAELVARIESPDTFMSLEEYMSSFQTTSDPLYIAYCKLLEQPEYISVSRTPAVKAAQAKLPSLGPSYPTPAISNKWGKMDAYWKWVTELYQRGMTERFGGLAAVEADAVPLGVVKVFKEGKVRWHDQGV